MAILWMVGEEIVNSGEAQALSENAWITAQEIAGGLVAAGWAVMGGIGYWLDRSVPPTPPGMVMGWCTDDGFDITYGKGGGT